MTRFNDSFDDEMLTEWPSPCDTDSCLITIASRRRSDFIPRPNASDAAAPYITYFAPRRQQPALLLAMVMLAKHHRLTALHESASEIRAVEY